MASYRGHLMLAAPLGLVYGGLSLAQPQGTWAPAALAAGLTALGGLLPDLDSDSGVPVRELFGVLAALVPACLFAPLMEAGFTLEQTLVILAGTYLFVKFPLAGLFKSWTVHRGMFHSIPAMFIAGLLVYLVYPHANHPLRVYLAGGTMLGFLSHLILDEIYAVDFNGITFKQNRFAGSALKFASPSVRATGLTYLLLAVLVFVAWTSGPAAISQPAQAGAAPSFDAPREQPAAQLPRQGR
jgi:LexA-binding, inner membrane-associated putative hydrolase